MHSIDRIREIFLCILLSGFFACKKESEMATQGLESQGTNFNLLLKTITSDNAGDEQKIVEYSYDANQRVSQITTRYAPAVTHLAVLTENLYRNDTGRLDSIVWISNINGTLNYRDKTYFSYDGSGRLILSRAHDQSSPFPDSSVYIYSGNILQKRMDYRISNNGSYSLVLQVTYEFDPVDNMTQAIFEWTYAPSDTLHFRYDDKVNPLPGGPVMFYLAAVYYNDYRSTNNLTQLLVRDVSSVNYSDYKYTSNN